MDLSVVARGAALTLVLLVVPAAAIRVLAGSPAPDLVYSLYLVLYIVAFVVGGVAAGRAEPARPYTHGAAAGGLAAGVLFVVGLALAAGGGRLSIAAAITVGVSVLVAVSLSMIGAVLGRRRPRTA